MPNLSEWMDFPYEHSHYQRYLRRMGLTHLAEAGWDKRSEAAAQAAGQGRLF